MSDDIHRIMQESLKGVYRVKEEGITPQKNDDDEGDEGVTVDDLYLVMAHIQCDLLMQFLQIRQHHWHVKGIQFRDIHLFFDECTEDFLEYIDQWAEHIVGLGKIAPTNPLTIAKISDIPIIGEDVTNPRDMLQQLIDGCLDIKEDYADCNDICEELRENGIINTIGEAVDGLDKILYKAKQFLG